MKFKFFKGAALAAVFTASNLFAFHAAYAQESFTSSRDQQILEASQNFLFELEKHFPVAVEDVKTVSEGLEILASMANKDPQGLVDFVNAFQIMATEEDKQRANTWSKTNGLAIETDGDPLAFWGVVAVVAIAILVGNGCDGGDGGCGGSCPTAGPCDGSSGGDSSSSSTGGW